MLDSVGSDKSEEKQNAMKVTVDPRLNNEGPDLAYGQPNSEIAANEHSARSPFTRNIRDGSENIDISVQGNTPCKPDIEASATRDKQLKFLQ